MRFQPLVLLAPFLPTLALAKPRPLAMALAEPELLPPTSDTCPCYPDNADSVYKGYLGPFRAIGFPYRIGCPGQGVQVAEARIEDTVRRALGADPVPPSGDLGPCTGTTLPIYQGTVYIGSIQILVAWDAAAKQAQFCSLLTPQGDCSPFFATPLCDRPAKG